VTPQVVQFLPERRQQSFGGRQMRLMAAIVKLLNQPPAADDPLVRFADASLDPLQVSIGP